MNRIVKLARVNILLAATLAVCIFAGAAHAQSAYIGRFTLPFEVRWGAANLPAGDYQIVIKSLGDTAAFIQETHGKARVLVSRLAFSESRNLTGGDAVLIERDGRTAQVSELRLASRSVVLTYQWKAPARSKKQEEARAIQAVPIHLDK